MTSSFHPDRMILVDLNTELNKLAIESNSLPFYDTLERLGHVIRETMQKVTTSECVNDPSNHQIASLINRHYADKVIETFRHILGAVYKSICRCLHAYTIFDSENVKKTVTIIRDFVEVIFLVFVVNKTNKIERKTSMRSSSDVTKVFSCTDKIICRLTLSDHFESGPRVLEKESLLWEKLNLTESSAVLIYMHSNPLCLECLDVELAEEGNFAITDCCSHLLCVDCAKKILNVRNMQESRCPVCLKKVKAWTDNKHFSLFKSMKSVKSKMWSLVQDKTNVCSLL